MAKPVLLNIRIQGDPGTRAGAEPAGIPGGAWPGGEGPPRSGGKRRARPLEPGRGPVMPGGAGTRAASDPDPPSAFSAREIRRFQRIFGNDPVDRDFRPSQYNPPGQSAAAQAFGQMLRRRGRGGHRRAFQGGRNTFSGDMPPAGGGGGGGGGGDGFSGVNPRGEGFFGDRGRQMAPRKPVEPFPGARMVGTALIASGVAPGMGAALMFAGPVTAGLVAAINVVKSFTATVKSAYRELGNFAESISAFSPTVATAMAQQEVADIMQRVSMAQRYGDEAASFVSTSGEFQRTLREAGTRFLISFAPLLEAGMEMVISYLKSWGFDVPDAQAQRDEFVTKLLAVFSEKTQKTVLREANRPREALNTPPGRRDRNPLNRM